MCTSRYRLAVHHIPNHARCIPQHRLPARALRETESPRTGFKSLSLALQQQPRNQHAPRLWRRYRSNQSGSWHGKHLRPGRKPGPGPPGVSSRCTAVRANVAGLHALAAMWLGGRHEVRQQQPRALLEDTGLQPRPTTDGSTDTPAADAHVCADGPIFHLFSRSSPASSKLQLRT
jgi:hypothetical protein